MESNFTQYKNRGWAIERNVYSKIEIKDIKENIKKFLTKNLENYSGRDINFFSDKVEIESINSFHKMDDCHYVRQLALSNKIYNISKKYLEAKKPDLRACELFAKPKLKGLAAPIHQDNYYWCVNDANALTIWLALDKSSKENGGVFYYDGSHKNGVFEHTPSNEKGSSQKIKDKNLLKKFSISTPDIEIGDCIIHHSLTAHGSDANESGSNRSGLTFQFKSDESYYDKELKNSYERSLNKQISNRGQ
tara:strand:+ start:1052 stop:1795 length:744 start_codon:yes stop_codon:yes gene_type:complete